MQRTLHILPEMPSATFFYYTIETDVRSRRIDFLENARRASPSEKTAWTSYSMSCTDEDGAVVMR